MLQRFSRRCFATTAKKVSTPSTSVLADFKMTAGNMQQTDEEIYTMIETESCRQKESILLSPTSNYTSRSVLDTLQTVLQNKYSEGYPGARYYGGNENVDDAELLTQKRALQLFNLNESEWNVNVQPLGGYNALFQVLTALILPSSKIMTPSNNSISQKQSSINKFFNILKYDNNDIDENKFKDLINNYSPNLIISGNGVDSSFNNFTLSDYKFIYKICHNKCYHICDISDNAGLIATNLNESPFEFCDVVICSPFATLRGPRGSGMIFYRTELSSKIDSAVFPGHQGGPHNHTISAMATCLKMAKTNEFYEYQNRCIKNAEIMKNQLLLNNYKNIDVRLNSNNKTCIGIKGLNNMDIIYDIANKVNMEIFYDKINNEFRISSNAMTTRGLDANDFNTVIDLFNNVNTLSINIKENGYDKCENDINSLKTEIGSFAKQFPLIGVDE